MGTASPARQWLLIEVPGRWGPRVLADAPLPPETIAALEQLSRQIGARVQLIRRPGRQHETSDSQRLAFVDSRPGRESVRWASFVDHDQLVRRVRSIADGQINDPEHGWGVASPSPLYLVCTHGRHDQCCAVSGRPVAAQFAANRPVETWECSHLGGDRFAANCVVLPHGIYYGRVDALDALAIIAATDAGKVVRHQLRGRSCYSPVEQAAWAALNDEFGNDDIDGVTPTETVQQNNRHWTVSAQLADGREVQVDVQSGESDPIRATCSHLDPVPMRILAGQNPRVAVDTSTPE